MSSSVKRLGLISIYLLPGALVYYFSVATMGGLHMLIPSVAQYLPSIANYSMCTVSPENVKSFHFFSVFYSLAVPSLFFKKAIARAGEIGGGVVIIGLVLAAFSMLCMVLGFPLEEADGAGGAISIIYCRSEFAAFVVLGLISAGASTFYLMFIIFVYLYVKGKLISGST